MLRFWLTSPEAFQIRIFRRSGGPALVPRPTSPSSLHSGQCHCWSKKTKLYINWISKQSFMAIYQWNDHSNIYVKAAVTRGLQRIGKMRGTALIVCNQESVLVPLSIYSSVRGIALGIVRFRFTGLTPTVQWGQEARDRKMPQLKCSQWPSSFLRNVRPERPEIKAAFRWQSWLSGCGNQSRLHWRPVA